MKENRCVVCDEIIPEGRQVCPNCEIVNPKIEFACKVCRAKQRYVTGRKSNCGWSIIGEFCPWLKETLEQEKKGK